MTITAKSLPLSLKNSHASSKKNKSVPIIKNSSVFIKDIYENKLDSVSNKFYKDNKVKTFLKKILLNNYYDFDKRVKYFKYMKKNLYKQLLFYSFLLY